MESSSGLAGIDWCLGTVVGAPVLPKRGLEMSPHPLVSSAQGWQRSVLAKMIFSIS